MKRRIPDPILMLITLLVITGFQLYWIRDNYFREKKALEIRTNGLFRETVRQVQDSLLRMKLSLVIKQHKKSDKEDEPNILNDSIKVSVNHTVRIASVLGAKRMMDSPSRPNEKTGVFMTIRKKAIDGNDSSAANDQYEFPNFRPEDIKEVVVLDSRSQRTDDSALLAGNKVRNHFSTLSSRKKPGNFPNIMYFDAGDGRQIGIRVDSLFKDSISIPLLSREFAKVLDNESLNVSFLISKEPQGKSIEDGDTMLPRFPFGNFSGYSFKLIHFFSYLIRKITFPIIFSILLIAVTFLSFILLYRNLLKQQRLALMKNDFISNISHELKTPIATVGVAIEALRSFGAANNPERTKEYLAISASELQRLGLLVDKVLRLSMFENREIELKKETLDVQELVHEVLNIMKLQFDKYHASVNVTTTGNNFMIEADRLHIISVLYNLLDNALKYTPDNPIIEVQLTELPRDIIQLKVKDNGIGISKEYQRKIFEKFFRVPMGNQHNIKGYGLGLSYVSEIIHQHMGYITVDSEFGKGTTFTINLPRQEADVIYFDDKRRIYKKSVKSPLAKLKGKKNE